MVKVTEKEQLQRDYHIRLDEDINRRFTKYIRSEFRRGAHVVTAVISKALDEYLVKKGH